MMPEGIVWAVDMVVVMGGGGGDSGGGNGGDDNGGGGEMGETVTVVMWHTNMLLFYLL